MNRKFERLYRAEFGVFWRGSEKGFDTVSFLFQNARLFVFAVMTCVFAVGFFFLVEVEVYLEVFVVKLRIHMEARIARLSERANEACFFAVLSLERVARTPEEVHGIVGYGKNSEFHCRGTGN